MSWLIVSVFVGVVALIGVCYWVLFVREEEKVLGRLKPTKAKKTTLFKGVLKSEERLSAVEPLNQALERSPLFGPLRRLLDQSGVRLNLSVFLLMSACASLVAYLLVVFFTHLQLVALAIGVLAAFGPYAWVRRARTKRMHKFEETFPEAIDLISRALKAGHALPTGLSMVGEEMAAPVGTEFRTLFDEQNFGLSLPDAMRNFAKRIPVLDARFFVTAVLTQREAGGNLSEVLDNLAHVIRERFKVKRQIRVISAHGRITGFVLAGLPPCLALATLLINPDHLGILLGDPIGIHMIEVGLVMQVVGTLVMRKIIQIEY